MKNDLRAILKFLWFALLCRVSPRRARISFTPAEADALASLATDEAESWITRALLASRSEDGGAMLTFANVAAELTTK